MPDLVALDVGDRRIGVATAEDERSGVATPVGVVVRRSRERDVEHVAAVLDQLHPARLVVGVPLSLDNELTDQARSVLGFMKRLAQRFDGEIVFVDEAFSSIEAQARYARRPTDDAAAAAIILERYLQGRAVTLPGIEL